MSAADRILDRLHGVKKAGDNRWMARCPAHVDSSASLSIRALDDGRVLINDFAGCGAADIVAALGLTLADLFDKPLANPLPPLKSKRSARELIEVIAHEVTVAMLLVEQAANGEFTPEDYARLLQAAALLGKARAEMQS